MWGSDFFLLFHEKHLELVQVTVEGGDLGGESLPRADGENGLVSLVSFLHRVSAHGLPVVKAALGEGLSSGVTAEIGGETETLHDGQVGKEGHLGGTRALLLAEDVATTLGEDTVDVTHGILGHRDVAQVDGLKKTGVSSHEGGEADTTGSGHDLSHTTVDSISVEDNIHQVEAAAAHDLLTKRSVLGGPSESSDNRLLDL